MDDGRARERGRRRDGERERAVRIRGGTDRGAGVVIVYFADGDVFDDDDDDELVFVVREDAHEWSWRCCERV